eukprot:6784800-Pyramimonas_sp.AAC.1
MRRFTFCAAFSVLEGGKGLPCKVVLWPIKARPPRGQNRIPCTGLPVLSAPQQWPYWSTCKITSMRAQTHTSTRPQAHARHLVVVSKAL